MQFKLGTKVTGAQKTSSGIVIDVENAKDASKKEKVIIIINKYIYEQLVRFV